MTNLAAKTKKGDLGFHAVVAVETPYGTITHKSHDQFVTKATALKHAEAWRNECRDYGYITQA